MVVCKYFLRGTCKFGTYCHYEHQAPSNYINSSFTDNNHQPASILRQANFGSAQSQNPKPTGATGNIDVNTLVKSVVNDMTGAEKGSQWLLSCYAPFKEKPAFPGFEDQSPEEIRLGFYEAQKNGTIDQYKPQLQALLQNSMMKIKALQNPAQDVVAILQNIYSTPPSSYSGTYGQNIITASTAGLNPQNTYVFPTQNKTSPFRQSNDNIFKTNNPASNTNLFGGQQSNFIGGQQTQGQTNIFGNAATSPTQNQNLFGGNTYVKPQNGIFGTQPGSNIFGSQGQTSNNIFSSQASAQSSIFGSTQPSTNIFGPTSPSNQNQNLFTSQNTSQQTIFGQQPSPQTQQNIFASQSQPQNVPTQNVFSSQNPQQQQQNVFNANTNSAQFPNSQPRAVPSALPNYSASIFGYSGNSNPSMGFGSAAQQPIDTSLYCKLEELTVEEIKWFESDTLDIMNIPDKPPTYDMCFKV